MYNSSKESPIATYFRFFSHICLAVTIKTEGLPRYFDSAAAVGPSADILSRESLRVNKAALLATSLTDIRQRLSYELE